MKTDITSVKSMRTTTAKEMAFSTIMTAQSTTAHGKTTTKMEKVLSLSATETNIRATRKTTGETAKACSAVTAGMRPSI